MPLPNCGARPQMSMKCKVCAACGAISNSYNTSLFDSNAMGCREKVQVEVRTLEELVQRAQKLLEQAEKTGRRKVLGIVGKPGAGKSTVAEVIVRKLLEQEMDKTTSSSSSSPSGQSTRWAIDSPVVLVPMDGFHMSNRVLAAIGLADRKGAPQTFDAAGYTNLLSRVHGKPLRGAKAGAAAGAGAGAAEGAAGGSSSSSSSSSPSSSSSSSSSTAARVGGGGGGGEAGAATAAPALGASGAGGGGGGEERKAPCKDAGSGSGGAASDCAGGKGEDKGTDKDASASWAEEAVFFPIFDRSIEESIAAQGVVSPACRLVVTEGNYLLCDAAQHGAGAWAAARAYLDETWFVDVDQDLRMSRLISRHISFGKAPAAADAWARGTDEANALLIGATKDRADVVAYLPQEQGQEQEQQKK